MTEIFNDNKFEDVPYAKPYENEHACRLEDPNKFVRFRRQNNAAKVNGKRVDFIFGITQAGKTARQAIRYPKSIWSASDARSHCSSNEGSFEAAK